MHGLWTIAICLSSFVLLRLDFVLRCSRRTKSQSRNSSETCSTAIFLGSGGHTTEMLALVSSLNTQRYQPRLYIISEGDNFSAKKAFELEQRLNSPSIEFSMIQVPRARRVHQTLFTTPPTALWSLMFCIKVALQPSRQQCQPFSDLLLMNGPGTCFTLCLAVLLCRILGRPTPRLVYIESFTRVSSLSTAGKLVRPIVDRFIVQWPTASQGQECRGWLV